MVVFSVILMLVVLFWRKGIMGQKEFSWDGLINFFKRAGNRLKGNSSKKGGAMNG
jgi:branched-chain amino acid transport system permease protein